MSNAYLSDEDYKLVTDSVPIVCVDVIPVRKQGDDWEIGVITRATGSQAGKAALIGGRVQHNEQLSDAINRHIKTDLNINSYGYWEGNAELHPFRVQQYMHAPSAESPLGYDPSKHAIGLTFLITLDAEPQPKHEAAAFHWLQRNQVPANADCGYNHDIVMQAAFDFLNG